MRYWEVHSSEKWEIDSAKAFINNQHFLLQNPAVHQMPEIYNIDTRKMLEIGN